MFARHALEWFSQVSQRRPRTTACLSGGILTGAGDGLAQYMEWRSAESLKPFTLDVQRNLANSSFSAAYASCVYLPFYTFLGRRLGEEVRTSVVATKVAANIFGLCPLVGLPSYFVWTGCVQGRSAEEILETIRREYRSCYVGSLCIWPVVQSLNFALVPPHMQVTFVYVGQITWAAMMSLFSNRRGVEDGTDSPARLHKLLPA
eukprot:TRINITY_DN43762_c0_g1_i1.p1 TRINITY_DN43762_c0_g1~~TRINITY_DN43762_c0_g1_i1.p1  ORF type:complete len:204 (+),score=23.44 TRINITY_DN43762_c0_g1_i1:87-698(+)